MIYYYYTIACFIYGAKRSYSVFTKNFEYLHPRLFVA